MKERKHSVLDELTAQATITVEQAAKVLGLGRTAAYEAARRGEFTGTSECRSAPAYWHDEDRIKRLIEDLAKIDTRFNIDTRSKDRPKAPLESLIDESKREKFLALMEQNLKALNG